MKHLNSIDIVRSLSMLYILIFHCGNYTEEINFQPWGDFLKKMGRWEHLCSSQVICWDENTLFFMG